MTQIGMEDSSTERTQRIYARVAGFFVFATRNATHLRSDLHVVRRIYAAVRDLQVLNVWDSHRLKRLRSSVSVHHVASATMDSVLGARLGIEKIVGGLQVKRHSELCHRSTASPDPTLPLRASAARRDLPAEHTFVGSLHSPRRGNA
jgi:hypothetical protein